MKTYLLAVLLIFSTLSSGLAEDLWVRNRPFRGAVLGDGSEMLVQMDLFLQALEVEADDQGDVVVIGGFPITVQEQRGTRFVHLRDVVDAAGLRLSRNPAMNTVDVRHPSAGTGSRGNWSEVFDEGPGVGSDESATKIAGAYFSITIPGHLDVVAERKYLKSEEKPNARVAQLNNLASQVPGTESVCMVATDAGVEMGGLTLTLIEGFTDEMDLAVEKDMLEVLKRGVLGRGGQLVGRESTRNIAGKRFYQFRYEADTERGFRSLNEVFVHFSNKHQSAFLFTISAPKHQFNRISPQLRLVVRNIRIK